MAILASEGEKKEFVKVPAGTIQGVCYDIYDLGLQESVFNNEVKVQHKVIIAWEVNELIPEGLYAGKRMTISKKYTLSLHEKANLRKDLEAWRGAQFSDDELRGFDLESLIGVNAMLSVVHNKNGDKTYANVAGVSKLMKGIEPMRAENKRSTPEWVQKLKDKAINPEDLAPKDHNGEDIAF